MQIPPGCVLCGTCRYVGPPRASSVGGPSGCLAIVLLCFGILPGVLYLLFASSQTVYTCQNCGHGTGPGSGQGGGNSAATGCLIVIGIMVALSLLGSIARAVLRA